MLKKGKKLGGRTIQRTRLPNLLREATHERIAVYGDEILDAIKSGEKPIASSSHYEIVEELGEGGMGTVFLAEHVSAGDIRKRVAIKVIKDTHDRYAIDNFIQEARISAQLSQGTIVEVLALEQMELNLPAKRNPQTGIIDPQRKGELYFMVMEFIDGPGFDRVLAQHKQHGLLMHPAMIGFVLNKCAIALAEAHLLLDEEGHPMGLVHRDISPSNILIAAKAGITKLADFGVARAFRDFEGGAVDEDRQVVGKPRYMAPEQLEGRAEAASDIWSIGVIAYEALTGYAPYRVQGDSLNAIVNNLRKQHLYRLRAPAEIMRYRSNYYDVEAFSDLIMACLRQKPAERPTAQQFIDAMESNFLYRQGLGPTNKTLAAYLRILDGVDSVLAAESGEVLESDEARMLRKVLRVKSVQHCFRKRTASMYAREFLTALKQKENNPCLCHGLVGAYEPDL